VVDGLDAFGPCGCGGVHARHATYGPHRAAVAALRTGAPLVP
jgi:hypothetical protein